VREERNRWHSRPLGVENAIWPFALGRNGWLFADTVNSSIPRAHRYSIFET
jgi:hypothetical protein